MFGSGSRPFPIACMVIALVLFGWGAWEYRDVASWTEDDIQRNVDMNLELYRVNVKLESRGQKDIEDEPAERRKIEQELRAVLADEATQAKRKMLVGGIIGGFCGLLVLLISRGGQQQRSAGPPQ